jgi:hypothetical protein
MSSVTVQDGAVVVRDGAVGTEQACCCDDDGEEEFVCDSACNKTVTVNWSNNGASGTLTYTIADRGTFTDIPGLRVSSSINCRSALDGKWFISVVMCGSAPYTPGNWAAILDAESDGCPPIGGVGWTTVAAGAGSDASASIS